MPSLDELVAPLTGAEFLQQYWHRGYLLQPGDADRFSGLLSWDELNRLLEFAALRPPRLRLVVENKGVNEDLYMEPGETYSHVNVAGMTESLAKGATLVIDRVDRLLPQLHRMAGELQQQLLCGVAMNVYGSWRTQKGFDLHWDKHDVLVLQVSGRKQWKVYQPTRLHPLRKDSQPAPAPTDAPVWEGVLEPGSILYLPRGWWHVAQAMEEPSLHITVGLTSYTGQDLLTYLVEKLRDDSAVRQDLPHLATQEERAAYCRRLSELLTEAASGDFLGAFEAARATEWVRSDLRPSLPAAVPRQLQPVTPASRLRLTQPVPLPFQPAAAPGLWRLTVGGKDWPCDDDVRQVLSHLSYARSMSLAELNSMAGSPQTQLKMRILLTVLTNGGLVFVE